MSHGEGENIRIIMSNYTISNLRYDPPASIHPHKNLRQYFSIDAILRASILQYKKKTRQSLRTNQINNYNEHQMSDITMK